MMASAKKIQKSQLQYPVLLGHPEYHLSIGLGLNQKYRVLFQGFSLSSLQQYFLRPWSSSWMLHLRQKVKSTPVLLMTLGISCTSNCDVPVYAHIQRIPATSRYHLVCPSEPYVEFERNGALGEHQQPKLDLRSALPTRRRKLLLLSHLQQDESRRSYLTCISLFYL